MLGYLIVFGVIGDGFVFLWDILPLRSISPALYYVTWFVAGVFCGLLAFDQAGKMLSPKDEGDWSNQPGAPRLARTLAATFILTMLALFLIGKQTIWQGSSSTSGYAPDSFPHTTTFLASIALGALIAIKVLPSADSKPTITYYNTEPTPVEPNDTP